MLKMGGLPLKNSLPAALKASAFSSSSCEVSAAAADSAAEGVKLIALTFSSIFCSSDSPTDSVSEMSASLSLSGISVYTKHSKETLSKSAHFVGTIGSPTWLIFTYIH